jgi:hypothetical protein
MTNPLRLWLARRRWRRAAAIADTQRRHPATANRPRPLGPEDRPDWGKKGQP